MAGNWTDQNKILPGMYMNFQTNAPSAISPGERGTVLLLQECSVGKVGDVYTLTLNDQSAWPEGATATDKFLAGEALKKAQTVKVYNLGSAAHTEEELEAALAACVIIDFNALCYPYDGSVNTTEVAYIKTWVTEMVTTEGKDIQAVVANDAAPNYEYIINVTSGVVLSDGTVLTPAQTTAWVAGATAGATDTTDLTGTQYDGAVDVSPRLKRSDMEAAIIAGDFIFKVNSLQNVTVVYDINSLTTFTNTKSKLYRKNRFIRLICDINNDFTAIYESQYEGKFNNNAEGRSSLKATLVGYMLDKQTQGAIQNFSADDLTIIPAGDSDAVAITVGLQSVDSIDKVYMTMNMS